ncbi:MAG TPA: hypothetical protein VN541_07345 [Tepidisphaeraceae bacterium]|nr:hypothetical protein [Tepidisphaeraceae bacterium]
MSDKGNVYYCSWERLPDGSFAGWEKKHPSRRASGRSTGELVQALTEVVGEYHNDHEAALDFDPPLESDEGNDALFADGFVEIGWNALFTARPSRETMFTGGRCKRCGGGIGVRAKEPLVVDSLHSPTDGAFCAASNEPPPCHGEPAKLNILSDVERQQFDARPVMWSPARRLKFYEIIPHAIIRGVVIRGREYGGWRCDVCGRRHYSNGDSLGVGVNVISRSDLPSPHATCFFVGEPGAITMCTTRDRWKELQGNRATRKMTSERLAVADEKACERQPKLPTLDQLGDGINRQGLSSEVLVFEEGVFRVKSNNSN